VHPDPSQALFGALIGLGLAFIAFGFSYLYERVSDLKQKQRSIDERWDSYIQNKKAEKELKEAREWKKKKK
ncbi:MAG: hypothetical protein AABY22_16160, partial [Nanoarchaeota archaeon]